MWLTSAYGAGHRLIARVILTRFASFTAVRKPALEPDRLQQGHPGGAPGQERHARHASDPRRRDARPAPLAARAGPEVTVRVHLRACRAVHHGRLCSACGARWCGRPAGLQAHPHMLRHACGFALANKGHDTRALQAYLGHRNIQHTVRYTELSPQRFKDFWR